jgi:hypothetical protein
VGLVLGLVELVLELLVSVVPSALIKPSALSLAV